MSDQHEQDIEVLSDNLYNLLSGELRVGVGLLKVGGSLKREGANKVWVRKGLQRWIEENEEAIPLLAAALGERGIAALDSWARSQGKPTY